MRQLLNAGFTRLWRNKMFWAVSAVCLGIALVAGKAQLTMVSQSTHPTEPVNLERYFFGFAPYLGIAFAVFTPFLLGPEYADGTIRNKLIVGHSRWAVYMSGFLVCFSAGLILDAIFYLGMSVLLFRLSPISWWPLVAGSLMVAALTASFAAVNTFIGTLSPNKALNVVLMFGLWFLMALAADRINHRLGVLNLQGLQTVQGKLLELIRDALPTGQALLLGRGNVEALSGTALSVLLAATVIGLGLVLFRRKDLK